VRHGPRFLAQQILNARIGLEAGQHGAALAAFESAARDPEADATSLTDAGWGLYMAGAAAQAAAAVARALEHDSGYGNAHHLKGWLELAAGKPAAASRSLEAAFEHTPHSFGSAHQGQVRGDLAALYYAGVAAQRAGDQQRALALFTRLIALGRYAPPDAAAATTILGWQAANFCARASARLGRTTAEPPALHGDDSTFFVQSARLHSVAGRRAQALQELARGLALGFGEYRHLQDDPDFLSLHESAEFRRLVSDRLPR
jgi:tetratricopeptide (TPR) repeat protein